MPRPYGRRDLRDREYVPPVSDGNRRGMVRLSPMVPPEVHALAYSNAKAAGISMGRYLAEIIKRDQLDENGVPLWIRDGFDDEQRELPLTG